MHFQTIVAETIIRGYEPILNYDGGAIDAIPQVKARRWGKCETHTHKSRKVS
jgi:hypothetical protein